MVLIVSCAEITIPPTNYEPITWGIPDRPELENLKWNKSGDLYCLTEEQGKILMINVERLKTHIIILENQIKDMEEYINNFRTQQ